MVAGDCGELRVLCEYESLQHLPYSKTKTKYPIFLLLFIGFPLGRRTGRPMVGSPVSRRVIRHRHTALHLALRLIAATSPLTTVECRAIARWRKRGEKESQR